MTYGPTKKAEPPPTRDVNRDSGTDSANGGWLRRLVRLLVNNHNCFRPAYTATTSKIKVIPLAIDQPTLNAMLIPGTVCAPCARTIAHANGYMKRSTKVK